MTERHFHNVAEIAGLYLCCSCGICEALCPEKAVALKETPGGYLFPQVNGDHCTGCGTCVQVCPGVHLLADLPEDPFTGSALGCWVGRAARGDVYASSQSGGGVTAVLMALMEAGRIKGAATVSMEAGSPPRPAVRIARRPEELLLAQGSKYCPVPLLRSIGGLMVDDGPIAVVGLACHIHGLHNMFELFPEFRKKVGPVIGLVCDRVLSGRAIDYLLWRSGAGPEEQVSFQFRSKEWRGYPGDIKISGAGRETVYLPNRERMKIKDYFTPARCRLCFDKMNVLADLTACDPWGVPDADVSAGETALAARTPRGQEAVRLALEMGHLDARETPYGGIVKGQAIEQKRQSFSGYCSAWRYLKNPLPEQAEKVRDPSLAPGNAPPYATHLRQAMDLDRFPSRSSMLVSARRWTRKQRLKRRITALFRR